MLPKAGTGCYPFSSQGRVPRYLTMVTNFMSLPKMELVNFKLIQCNNMNLPWRCQWVLQFWPVLLAPGLDCRSAYTAYLMGHPLSSVQTERGHQSHSAASWSYHRPCLSLLLLQLLEHIPDMEQRGKKTREKNNEIFTALYFSSKPSNFQFRFITQSRLKTLVFSNTNNYWRLILVIPLLN